MEVVPMADQALLERARQLGQDLAREVADRGQLDPHPELLELARVLGFLRRLMPQNLDAEEVVIGGILFAGRALNQVAEFLLPADFYHPALRAIYEAMLELDSQSRPIDLITVAEQMRKSDMLGKLKAHGGEAYLAELSSKITTVENITHHAQIVKEKATARQLIEASSRILDLGFRDGLAADEYMDRAQRAVFEVAVQSNRAGWEPAKKVLHETLRSVEARLQTKEAITGVPTGYNHVDEKTAGLQRGDLVIIAGRPSMGKTAYVMNCATHAACRHKIPVYVFSLEMGRHALMERILCAEARIRSENLRTGHLDARDMLNMTRIASDLSEAPIVFDDRGAPTLQEIRAKVRRWRADPKVFPPGQKLGMVVIDYLGLISGTGDSREREVSAISRGLKALARDVELPIVVLSQLSRDCEKRTDKRPLNSDLRDSGQIEADADVIMFVYRDEVYDPLTTDKGVAEIIIRKQRNGPTGTARLAFLDEYTRFENLSHRHGP
jgi:replicative DNA helicase